MLVKTTPRRDIDTAAEILISLHGEAFGGKPAGRYQLSRKSMRQVLGRRHLPSEVIQALADELFEEGYLLLDLETHFAILEQRNVNHYRRVTTAALAKVTELTSTAGLSLDHHHTGNVK